MMYCRKNKLLIMTFFILITCLNIHGVESANSSDRKHVFVKITLGNTVLTAIMEDNKTAEDFISQMPLTIKMRDLAGDEKYGYASEKLDTDGVQGGYDPEPGDICCYVPWGNVCIYYSDHGYENLIKIGTMESGGAAVFASYPSDVTVLFEINE